MNATTPLVERIETLLVAYVAGQQQIGLTPERSEMRRIAGGQGVRQGSADHQLVELAITNLLSPFRPAPRRGVVAMRGYGR